MRGRTDAPYIMHDLKNNDFGVGGNVKFFLQKRILYPWTQNSPI